MEMSTGMQVLCVLAATALELFLPYLAWRKHHMRYQANAGAHASSRALTCQEVDGLLAFAYLVLGAVGVAFFSREFQWIPVLSKVAQHTGVYAAACVGLVAGYCFNRLEPDAVGDISTSSLRLGKIGLCLFVIAVAAPSAILLLRTADPILCFVSLLPALLTGAGVSLLQRTVVAQPSVVATVQ
jgi:hypothetical protein